jgi:2-(1,2-epoxy-1,2-dihydrophenyl)acetyl-CoA isomerase
METLILNKVENLLVIKLNRPESLNAITTKMLKELNNVFSEAQKDNSIRAILLTGEGKGFCSGQDLKDIENLESFSFYEHLVSNYNPLILKMRAIEKPIIVGINGTCAGAGLSLALAGDIRIAKRSAKWTNEIFDSQKSLELGIINKIFEDDGFENKIIEFSLNIANGPTKAYAISKRFYNRIYELNLNEVLELEAQYQEVLGKTKDFKEGIKAFIEKRKPNFKGY